MFEPNLQGLATKAAAISLCFSKAIGTKLVRYETAEIQHIDGRWAPWPDLPMRLHTDGAYMVSVCWSRFDDLWLSNDSSLPFQPDEATTRWVSNGMQSINECLGRTIRAVHLGRGGMTIEDREIEIWTRLVVELEDRWLEIFNALDENGYQLHAEMPAGDFTLCG